MTSMRKTKNSARYIFTDCERKNRYLNMNPHALIICHSMGPDYYIWRPLPKSVYDSSPALLKKVPMYEPVKMGNAHEPNCLHEFKP